MCERFPESPTPNQPHYWCYARHFMILAAATGQADILNNAEPEKLFAKFEQWREKLDSHIRYLLPHPTEPVWIMSPRLALGRVWKTQDLCAVEKPFPEWDKAPFPPPVSLMHDLPLDSTPCEKLLGWVKGTKGDAAKAAESR